MIYSSHSPETSPIGRILSVTVALFAVVLIFTVNYFSAQLNKSAHKSYPLLYTLLCKKKFSMRNKLKILFFIENLSGLEIGFYCYDLFPINNYTFYEFTAGWAANYLLLVGFV